MLLPALTIFSVEHLRSRRSAFYCTAYGPSRSGLNALTKWWVLTLAQNTVGFLWEYFEYAQVCESGCT